MSKSSDALAAKASTRRSVSLEYKLPLAASGLLVVLSALYTWIAYNEVANNGAMVAAERDARLATELATLTANNSATRARLVSRTANSPAVTEAFRTGSFANTAETLQQLRLPSDSGITVVIFDELRRPIQYVDIPPDPEIVGRATAVFDDAVRRDSLAVSTPFFENEGRAYYWSVAAVRAEGRPLGWVAQLRLVGNNPNAVRTLEGLIGANNRVLVGNRNDTRTPWLELGGKIVPGPELNVHTQDYRKHLRAGEWHVVGIDTIAGTPWQVMVETPLAVTQARANQFLRRIGLILLLLLLTATAVVWLASRRVTGPLRRLSRAANALAQGRYQERVDIHRRDELGALGQAFNRMAGQIQQSIDVARESRAHAEQANRSKSEFLANMSHEIRTPINAMLGYADLMDLGIAGPVTNEQREQLERIRLSGKHLIGLVDDLLDFARLETARLVVEQRVADAADTIHTAVTVVAPQAAAKPIRIDVRCEPATSYIGDPQRVEQILVNLLGNAVKFTPPNGQVTLECRPVRANGRPRTEFVVADTGIGIAEDQIQAVFEPFVQAQRGYTRPHGGSGLGLSISRRLAQLMGGEIGVQSRQGEGSRFTLTLPAPE